MITIRPATSADLPQLTHLWHEKTVMVLQFDRRFALLPDGAAEWGLALEHWLKDDTCTVLVALSGDHILGYVVGHVESSPPGLSPEQFGVVTDMAVDLHGQAGGIGKALLTALREWFAERGLTILIAHVPHRSAVEQAFWRAQGGTDWVDLMWMKV